MMNKKRIGIVILCIVGIIVGAFFIYFADYSRATDEAITALESDDDVNVTKIDEGYYFDGYGKENAIIFLPGAKIEAKAYGNLMKQIAANGVDCFLVDVPFNFAFFGTGQVSSIMDGYNYSHWIMSGHSLGGSVASMYANDNSDRVDGLVLLAAYPNDKIDNKIRLLSIYGDKDGVLNKGTYDDAKKYWPDYSIEEIISGGNHANFGSYGFQKGDNAALISSLDQQNRTAMLIVEFLNS